MSVKCSATPPYHFLAPNTEQASRLVHALNGFILHGRSLSDYVESKPVCMDDDFFQL